MIYTTQLQKLGLNKEEAVIYETMLDKGQTNLVRLSMLTSINRPALYKIIPKMLDKGYIYEVKVGKRIEYMSSSPNKLQPLVSATKDILEKIVDNLSTSYAKKQIVPNIEIYYGREGIARIYMDIVNTLDRGETYYRYGMKNSDQDDYAPSSYRKLRDLKKIERLAIMPATTSKNKNPKLDRFVRVIPGEQFENINVTKFIYKNKVSFIDYGNKIGFIIFNPKLFELEKGIFFEQYKKFSK